MDEAWALEQEFWAQAASGNASDFYSRHLASDGFVVLPSGVVSRDELINRWDGHRPIGSYQLSEPTFTPVEGGNVAITYEVTMDAEWLPNYKAVMTAFYAWEGNRRALLFRAHTPSAPFPF